MSVLFLRNPLFKLQPEHDNNRDRGWEGAVLWCEDVQVPVQSRWQLLWAAGWGWMAGKWTQYYTASSVVLFFVNISGT